MGVLANVPLHYPSAREWMWDYCVYLGPYTDEEGHNYDLGIFLNPQTGNSAAIVYGDTPGEYLSGPMIPALYAGTCKSDRIYTETMIRAMCIGIM